MVFRSNLKPWVEAKKRVPVVVFFFRIRQLSRAGLFFYSRQCAYKITAKSLFTTKSLCFNWLGRPDLLELVREIKPRAEVIGQLGWQPS